MRERRPAPMGIAESGGIAESSGTAGSGSCGQADAQIPIRSLGLDPLRLSLGDAEEILFRERDLVARQFCILIPQDSRLGLVYPGSTILILLVRDAWEGWGVG